MMFSSHLLSIKGKGGEKITAVWHGQNESEVYRRVGGAEPIKK
jgi:hypothetical protein